MILKHQQDKVETWLSQHPKTATVFATLLTLLGLGWIIGPYLWSPNSHMYTFGGDGLVLYYDAAYHLLHGKEGVMLDAMLYPKEELIFITDAQGAWLVVWQWFNRHIADLSAYVTGIIHTTNNLGVLLATPFVYAILVKLKAKKIVALLFASLIVLLSPQMLRLGGHFGLAYPFIIPMTIWWLLRARRMVDWKDILVVAVLMFFTFNNAYVGFSAGLTLFVFGGLFALFNPKTFLKSSHVLIPMMGMAIALAVPYLTFKVLDPFDSRIDLQWGVFHFRTSFAGSAFPSPSIIGQWLSKSPALTFAAKQYLGLTSMLLVFAGAVAYIIRRLRKKASPLFAQVEEPLKLWGLYVISATVAYAFCYDWSLSEDTKMMLEKSAGFLLLFKSVARLAWPFYFAVGISGILILSRFFDWFDSRNRVLAYGFLLAVFAFNCFDVDTYHEARFKFHENHYELSRFENLKSGFTDASVLADDYQAILSVPRQLSWNGNMMVEWKWGTHYSSTNASVALGLPMINANLGRSPLRPLMDVTQLMSRQEIDRSDFLSMLPSQKPILLIHGKQDTVLNAGERFLIGLAEPVYDDKLMQAYRLDIAALQEANGTISINDETIKAEQFRSNCLNESNELLTQIRKGKFGHIYKTTLASTKVVGDSLTAHLSGWIEGTSARHGQGDLLIEVFDTNDSLRVSDWMEVRRLADAHTGWYYIARDYEMHHGDSLVVNFTAPQEIKVDKFNLTLCSEKEAVE